ncbi:hypothetical protein ACFLS4_02160 [Bacteroidota bacterium]
MITKQFFDLKSIVIIGGSDNIQKPKGKILKNLIGSKFKGDLYVANPKEDEADKMIKNLRSYGIIRRVREQEGVTKECLMKQLIVFQL